LGLLAHDTSADPIVIYANRTAQQCFEYSWEEFVRSVTEQGYASGYRGLRIAKSGRRFRIENVTMWNLVDADGRLHGQAAVFRSWRDLPHGWTDG
jgi:hypothetical protein